jgi:hypothetical protein
MARNLTLYAIFMVRPARYLTTAGAPSARSMLLATGGLANPVELSNSVE